ncbi:MAG: TRAP transporter substrate-binding protein [Succinivibrio sp.]|nr:TRAP transporter substrate-binding protein [Succinivibrio sp.]
MKKINVLLAAIAALSLTACGDGNNNKAEQTAAADSAAKSMTLNLAHNQNETHPVHQAIAKFAEEVAAKTNGRIQIKVFPNAQLGSETECLEQLNSGVLPMTKVSAPGLASFDDSYNTFGLPYLFKDTSDFYRVMDSKQMQDFFMSSADKGFVTLTYYTSGSRSFYTVKTPIRKPEDLKGLKIRVQNMKSQMDMVTALGGNPVAMSYGEVYTALSTGVIDGTENNETALTIGKHGEVCKVYSMDQHAFIPDALVMSAKVWNTISKDDQKIIIEAARNSTVWQKAAWDKATEEAIKEAKEKLNVEFITDVDKAAFQQATSGMVEQYSKEYPGVKKLVEMIKSI